MPIDSSRALEILRQVNAVLENDHFEYTSGRHGSVYFNKDAIYPHTELVRELCAMLAVPFEGTDIDAICGPALGGIILSQWTANHLGVLAVYAEKTGQGLALRRGYDDLVAGRRVGIVEDVLTTGGSLRDTVAAVEHAGGQVVGAAALVNRGHVTATDVRVPWLVALTEADVESWEADACPLCAQGLALNRRIGKGGTVRPLRPAPGS